MLTPRFEISQTDDELTITIHAPYASIAGTEVFVEEEHFRFYSSPYYLRLHLPGSVEETDSSAASYDADSGIFVVRVSKVNKGEHFPGLNLLTTLLAPRKPKVDVGKAGIEVIGEPCVPKEEDEDEDEGETDGSEWFIEQSIESSEDAVAKLTGNVTYGFAGHSKGVFSRFQGELSELLDLPEPDTTPVADRRKLQEAKEKQDFCAMHYLADLMEPEYIKFLLMFKPIYNEGDELLPKHMRKTIQQLPNREYLLSGPEKRSVYLGLVDILFAYCYDQRINEGEPNSESAWNINKLSATFSWLQVFNTVDEVVLSCLRRSLVYPLYRNWQLSLKVLQDVQMVLMAGQQQILFDLLDIYTHLFTSDLRYLLNRLYVQDYCIWVQSCSERKLSSMAAAISKCIPSKEDLGLELVEWETAGQLAQEEERQAKAAVDELAGRLDSMLAIGQKDSSSNDSEHSSKSDEEASVSSGSSNDSDSDTYNSESDSDSSSEDDDDAGGDVDSEEGSEDDLDTDDFSASD